MKIAAIADLHIGLKTYSKLDPITHFTYRELEVLDNLKKICSKLIEDNIPVLVISGDIYHSSTVSNTLQNEVNKILFSAANRGLKIIMIDGNHDRKKLSSAVSPLEIFSTFNIPNIIHARDFKEYELIIDNEIIKFILLPVYASSDEIKELINKATENYPNKCIILGHFSVAGAKMNDWLVAENEEYIDLNAFKKDNVIFTILGHLHKPQILNQKPLIFYTGSLQRTDFNEENQEKGYWILDTQDETYQFIPINTLNFYTIKDSLIEHSLAEIMQNIDTNKCNNAVVRIILNIDEEHLLNEADEKFLKDYLVKNNVVSISLKTQLENIQRSRNKELKEGLSIEKSIELYFKDLPRGNIRTQLAKDILTNFRKESL